MKKILTLAILLLLFVAPCRAFNVYETKQGEEEHILREIGFKILTANKIPQKTTFYININRKTVNACASYTGSAVTVYKGLYPYLDEEDELAAIVAHEIAHIIDLNKGFMKGAFSFIPMTLSSKKYETKADKRAVDFLVKAGYNPLALITALNKTAPQNRYDIFSSHPLTSKRLAVIYEYIYVKYPEYLVDNKYKDNVYYQNFLVTSKENRKKLEEKIKSGSNKNVKYK